MTRKKVLSEIHAGRKKKPFKREAWSKKELTAIKADQSLKVCLALGKVPAVSACKDAIDSCPILKKRSVVQVKSKVWTMIQQMKRMERS